MTEAHILTIAQELAFAPNRVRATAELLARDATVPFIARYRKEATGSLDDVAITCIRDRLAQLAELDKRREAILTSLKENGHLTDELNEREKIDPTRYVTETVGLPTIRDILAELARPGRDPREQFEAFQFAEGVEKLEDFETGMSLPGIVTNVTAFGALIDVGVHQDGLVHISQLADRFVKDPSEVVKVHQKVTVTVLDIDLARRRISLSMRKKATTGTARTT